MIYGFFFMSSYPIVEAALMEWAFDDTVHDHSIGEVRALVRAHVLRCVELAFGPVDGDGELADPDLLDVLVFEVGGIAGFVPVFARR